MSYLVATITLVAAAVGTLVDGFVRRDPGSTAASPLSSLLAAASLVGFARSSRDGRPVHRPLTRADSATGPPPPSPRQPACPIEDYERLNVSDVLPLLQELDPEALEAVAWHELVGRRRASILSRVSMLLAEHESSHAPQAPEPLVPVASRPEVADVGTTVRSRIAWLHRRHERSGRSRAAGNDADGRC